MIDPVHQDGANCRAIAEEIHTALDKASRLSQWTPTGDADMAFIRIKVPEADDFDYRVTVQSVRAAGPPADERVPVPVQITDEMVERAWRSFKRGFNGDPPPRLDDVIAALDAALNGNAA